MTAALFPTARTIEEASERIRSIARRTPVLTSQSFDAHANCEVHFKCENFQKGGSFKIRGASNLILSIPKAGLEKGIVAYSSGNHAQAVAIAARHVGAPATIVMPADAPRSKLEATAAQGARIVTYDRLRESREEIAARILEESGATLVPPFDHPCIMAGQGTTAREFLEQAPGIEALITPVGGGGLLSGCAVAARAGKPSIRILGAEPELSNDTFLSLQAGRHVEVDPSRTIADGLRAPTPGKLTFPVIQSHVERILLVSEDEIRATVKFLLTRMKILVEPSGAVAAAAVFFRKLPEEIRSVGVVLSGGNVDFDQLVRY
ncbi:MAG: threonine/serine dehydratase [Bryobacteraceae bacterium]